LFTYAQDRALSEAQAQALAAEGVPDIKVPSSGLVTAFERQVDRALEQLRTADERTLTDYRGVGRAQLPSTVLGLLVHAAEHTQRHVGQLLVTVRVQRHADSSE